MSQETTVNTPETPAPEPKKRPKIVEFFIYIIDGFIMGLGNVIPGVSGGTLALLLGVYEKMISSISNLFKKFKESIFFLLPLIIGVAAAFLILAHPVTYCLDHFLFATIMLFFGAVIGGLPMLFNKVKTQKTTASAIVIFLITFALTIGLLFLMKVGSARDLDTITFGKAILWFFLGAVAAATMVIPGVSGSAFLMTIGYYEPVMNLVKDLTKGINVGHAIVVLLIWGIGIIAGILSVAKLIEFLLKKYENKTYWGIIGFVIASAICIVVQNFFMVNSSNVELLQGIDSTLQVGQFISPALTLGGTSVLQYIIGIALAVGGFFLAYKLGDK